MRIESQIKVKVKDKVIGGPHPLICLPLVGRAETDLLHEAGQLAALQPDLIEWRADHYENHDDPDVIRATLNSLNRRISGIPLLFTCRSAIEGGESHLPPERRLQVNRAAVGTGIVDILDTELCNGAEFILPVKSECESANVKLLLSYHNFDQTPDVSFLVERLVQAQELGAHIAKIAVMPGDSGDLLKLLNAAFTARSGVVKIPIVAISMGAIGSLSRIAGGAFGSDITFAVGRKSSAPGQIPIKELRCLWEMMRS